MSFKFDFDKSTATHINGLWISYVEIYYVIPLETANHRETLMNCSFVFNEAFKVSSMKLMRTDHGVRVRFPDRMNTNLASPKHRLDIAYPVDPALRPLVTTVLTDCYQRALKESAVPVAALVEGGGA